MEQDTPRLALPLLQPSQAQKHVTHNEALLRLDALAQLSVEELDVLDPPASPAEGEAYGLGADPTGEWSGQGGALAVRQNGAWRFYTPRVGLRVWNQAMDELRAYDGSGWRRAQSDPDQLARLGISTTADNTNRLAVRSSASLLTHDGGGHQLKVNKAASGDTASLLFQSNWNGHAEMGLAGSTDFSIKVSDDGSTWTEALIFAGATGHVSGAAVQSSPQDTGTGKLMRADYGYGPGNLLGAVTRAGGLPTGAVIERGSTTEGAYVRFADGTQICTREVSSQDVSSTGVLSGFHRSDVVNYAMARAFSAPPACSVSRSTPGSGGILADVGYGSSVGWRLRFMAPAAFSAQATGILTLMAIGRWD